MSEQKPVLRPPVYYLVCGTLLVAHGLGEHGAWWQLAMGGLALLVGIVTALREQSKERKEQNGIHQREHRTTDPGTPRPDPW